jgi:hypothetical protein
MRLQLKQGWIESCQQLCCQAERSQPLVPAQAAGSTTRNSLRVLRPHGRLCHVWTNAERWMKEAGSETAGKVATMLELSTM